MISVVSPLVWVITVVVLVGIMILDLAVIGRRQRTVTTKDAVRWVLIYIGLAVAFVAGSGATLDPGGPFGHEVYFDSITMFVSFLLGARYLELRARHRAAEALEQAADALPGKVERLRLDGATEWVEIDQLVPGDLVRVAAGQRIPADARVEGGLGAADESLLTGESRPVSKAPGDAVLAGSLNLAGVLTLRVVNTGESTRLAGIRQLMAQAFEDRPATLRMADRVASWFLLAVLVLASASDHDVEVRVVDRGPGVSEADRATIFEPFRRLSDSHPDGVGLGLAVADGLARAVGAELSAEDTPGGGLTMVRRIPREEVAR